MNASIDRCFSELAISQLTHKVLWCVLNNIDRIKTHALCHSQNVLIQHQDSCTAIPNEIDEDKVRMSVIEMNRCCGMHITQCAYSKANERILALHILLDHCLITHPGPPSFCNQWCCPTPTVRETHKARLMLCSARLWQSMKLIKAESSPYSFILPLFL